MCCVMYALALGCIDPVPESEGERASHEGTFRYHILTKTYLLDLYDFRLQNLWFYVNPRKH